jgi:hypothetical protein
MAERPFSNCGSGGIGARTSAHTRNGSSTNGSQVGRDESSFFLLQQILFEDALDRSAWNHNISQTQQNVGIRGRPWQDDWINHASPETAFHTKIPGTSSCSVRGSYGSDLSQQETEAYGYSSISDRGDSHGPHDIHNISRAVAVAAAAYVNTNHRASPQRDELAPAAAPWHAAHPARPLSASASQSWEPITAPHPASSRFRGRRAPSPEAARPCKRRGGDGTETADTGSLEEFSLGPGLPAEPEPQKRGRHFGP